MRWGEGDRTLQGSGARVQGAAQGENDTTSQGSAARGAGARVQVNMGSEGDFSGETMGGRRGPQSPRQGRPHA